MYSVYIIYSFSLDKYYIGYTEDVAQRLQQHNEGISSFTSKASDWILKYTVAFENRALAHQRELEIKGKKSRKYIDC